MIDADLLDNGTRHPNLALMKISAYCKELGCYVELLEDYSRIQDFDLVFVSCVFTFTEKPSNLQELPNVLVGGTGFFQDGGAGLPEVIEHHMPDYELYVPYIEKQIANGRKRSWFADYLDYSIGFVTRGCFRKCSFCVNKKYSRAGSHSPVKEFLDESRPYIYLWDDNFLACAQWEQILDELISTGKPFQFRQGLDIRLLNDKRAAKLAHVKYAGDFIFAFDHIEDRPVIERGLKTWRKYSDRGTRLYVLCAYDSQDERDIANTFERIKILMGFGCLPYIMRYESYKSSRWRSLYINLARWCNQPQFFKKKSFRQFCEANQAIHKTEGTLCSAMQAMVDFESAFPDIAEQYFDLRFEDENMLLRYGRAFSSANPPTEVAEVQSASWREFASGGMSDEEALDLYFSKQMDIVWLQHFGQNSSKSAADNLFELLKRASLDEVFESILRIHPVEPITPANIPQFSDANYVKNVAEMLDGLQEHLTYEAMGIYLEPERKKAPAANKKFGENHGKLASMLDLSSVEVCGSRLGCLPTPFTHRFLDLPETEQDRMIAKLVFRIPIIAQVLYDAAQNKVSISSYLVILSESTKTRRLPNVVTLLSLIEKHAEGGSELMRAIRNVGR